MSWLLCASHRPSIMSSLLTPGAAVDAMSDTDAVATAGHATGAAASGASDTPAAALPAAAAAAAAPYDDDSDLEDEMDVVGGGAAILTARLDDAAVMMQQGQAALANLSSSAAGANAAAAAAPTTDADVPMSSDGDDGELALPPALRIAMLRMTPLHPHLLLFPSHKFDATYHDAAVPVTERRTSFDTAAPLEQYGCPVMMNTPDQRLNAEEDEDEAAAAARLIATALVACAPEILSEDTADAEVLGSPPPFLKQSSTDSGAPTCDVDDEEGEMVDGFVRCAKCNKWRTLPDDEEQSSASSDWTCDQNPPDARSTRCSSPDELFGDDELWPGMPRRFTRLVTHATFYQRLVALLQQGGEEGEEDYSAELAKFPQVRRQPVDLFRMYRSVLALGGYDKVSASNQWRTIQSCLHIPDQFDSSPTLKRLYQRILYPYELAFWKNPRNMGGKPSAPQLQTSATGAKHKSRGTKQSSGAASAAGSSTSGAAADSANRKRRQKHLRDDGDYAYDYDVGGGGGGGGGAARKRARKNDSLYEGDDNGNGAAGDSASEGEERMFAERTTEQRDRSRAQPPPAGAHGGFTSVNQNIYNLRQSVDARFRALEKRTEERLLRMESALTKAIRDAATMAQQAHMEQQRRDEKMAHAMNTLIADRLVLHTRNTQARSHADPVEENEAGKGAAAAAGAIPGAATSVSPASAPTFAAKAPLTTPSASPPAAALLGSQSAPLVITRRLPSKKVTAPPRTSASQTGAPSASSHAAAAVPTGPAAPASQPPAAAASSPAPAKASPPATSDSASAPPPVRPADSAAPPAAAPSAAPSLSSDVAAAAAPRPPSPAAASSVGTSPSSKASRSGKPPPSGKSRAAQAHSHYTLFTSLPGSAVPAAPKSAPHSGAKKVASPARKGESEPDAAAATRMQLDSPAAAVRSHAHAKTEPKSSSSAMSEGSDQE